MVAYKSCLAIPYQLISTLPSFLHCVCYAGHGRILYNLPWASYGEGPPQYQFHGKALPKHLFYYLEAWSLDSGFISVCACWCRFSTTTTTMSRNGRMRHIRTRTYPTRLGERRSIGEGMQPILPWLIVFVSPHCVLTALPPPPPGTLGVWWH